MQWLHQQHRQHAFELLQHPEPGQIVSALTQLCGYLSLASFSCEFGQ